MVLWGADRPTTPLKIQALKPFFPKDSRSLTRDQSSHFRFDSHLWARTGFM